MVDLLEGKPPTLKFRDEAVGPLGVFVQNPDRSAEGCGVHQTWLPFSIKICNNIRHSAGPVNPSNLEWRNGETAWHPE
jgi:hypothetical protein